MNVRSKDWSAKSFDELIGGLQPDDFVDLYELGEAYTDEAMANDSDDNSWEMLADATGADDTEIHIGDGVKVSLLGIFWIIGSRIAEDRELRSLDPEALEHRKKWLAYLADAQDILRSLPEEARREFVRRIGEG